MGSYRKLNTENLASLKEESVTTPSSEKEAQPPSGKAKALLNIRRKSAEAKSILGLRRKSVELSLNTSRDFQKKLLKNYNEAISKSNDVEFTSNDIANQSSMKASVSNECLSSNSKTSDNENPLERNELRRSKSERRISETEPVTREQDRNFLCTPEVAESPRVSPHPAYRKYFDSNPKDMNQKIKEALGIDKDSEQLIGGKTSSKPSTDMRKKIYEALGIEKDSEELLRGKTCLTTTYSTVKKYYKKSFNQMYRKGKRPVESSRYLTIGVKLPQVVNTKL